MVNGPSPSEIRAAQARAVGGSRPKCSIGKSCSAACITRTDMCLVEIPVSPSQAISKLRSDIENAKEKQLSLFNIAHKLKKKDVEAGVDIFKKRNQEMALEHIRKNSQEEYEKNRREAIAFNRRLVEDGLTRKVGLVNVPAPWERVQSAKVAYEKAFDVIQKRAIKAAVSGKRQDYLREGRKLIEMQRRIGEKVGSKIEKYDKGSIWFDNYESPSKPRKFLSSLVRNPALSKFSIGYYHQGNTLLFTTYVRNTSGGQSYKVNLEMTMRGIEFSFTVNGPYDRPKDLSRRDGIAISNTVRSAFKEISKSMSLGSIISVYPHEDDGRGEKRRKAYEAAGFKEGPKGDMYARIKDKSGNISPSSEDELRRFIERGRFNFTELRLTDGLPTV